MKLWKKGYELDQEIERFTVGDDPILDLLLAPYDCFASMAHARVLQKAGVLTESESDQLVKALEALQARCLEGDFTIAPEEEDCHTAIENHLVSELGELGKKIHTARSRNDQVLAALRLYTKDRLEAVSERVDHLANRMKHKIEETGHVTLPGYTHTRAAMPSSLALWMGSFVESLEDDKIVLGTALELVDQNPLGSGAGYGIPVFDLDRELSTKLLGFQRVQKNPLYVQNSRGKFESFTVFALSQVMMDLNRLAADLILFTMKEFGFFSLPEEICTGSSIMPQKLNPDVLELVRSGYHEVLHNAFHLATVPANLISGYHRDLQRTKKPFMESFAVTESSIRVTARVVEGLEVNRNACEAACTEEIHATEQAYRLVKEGVPFREAYRKVAAELFEKGAQEKS